MYRHDFFDSVNKMTTSKRAAAFPLRNPAARAVFASILAHGTASRGDVARRTGLSAAAVTKAVRPLIAAGLLIEGDGEAAGVGRPARGLRVHAEAASFVGVKLTGADVFAALTDFSGQVLATTRAPLGSQDVAPTVDDIARAVEALRLLDAPDPRESAPPAFACVTVSGDVDRDSGLVRFSPFLGWRDVPLARLVEERLGVGVVVENDVRALTLAEGLSGAGAGASPLVVVTLGAGIGCGIAVGDEVLTGAHGVSGELGHVPVGDPEVACYCGGRGCVEAVAADPAIVRRVTEATGVPVMTVAEAAVLARRGGAAAEVFAAAGGAIGRALAAVANLVGPERIVVSGEGLAYYDLFAQHIQAAFARQAYGATARCEVHLQPRSFEDWAVGASAVARDRFVSRGPGGLFIDSGKESDYGPGRRQRQERGPR
jgi:predicted NBD/HSP70 family sugar kinase